MEFVQQHMYMWITRGVCFEHYEVSEPYTAFLTDALQVLCHVLANLRYYEPKLVLWR